MNSDFARLLVTAAFAFSALILYQRWVEFSEPRPQVAAEGASQSQEIEQEAPAAVDPTLPQVTQEFQADQTSESDVPTPSTEQGVLPGQAAQTDEAGKVAGFISNDAVKLGFDERGNLVQVDMLRHVIDSGEPLRLFIDETDHLYIAQSGLLGDGLPNHLDEGWQLQPVADDSKTVTSNWRKGALQVQRQYTIADTGYLGQLRYVVTNNNTTAQSGHAYYQFLRDQNEPAGFTSPIPSYYGAAIYTDADKYNKYEFDDLSDYPKRAGNGWIGIVQRYFMAAWLDGGGERENFMNPIGDGNVRIGIIRPLGMIAPGGSVTLEQPIFIGALEQELLDEVDPQIGPGVSLAVDYGFLTIICAPLFSLLNLLYGWFGNWGISIILLTFLIKLVFYPLMSKSYRSMARMKKIAPDMQKLKEHHGDDRQGAHKATMELFRKEKVNPLSGCAPVIIQIPVFIALYWMLLESIELRHAPFIFWIQDLSSPDPLYILPVLLGVAMYGQFKLNPTPPDPTHAMIMKIMPIGFAAFSIFCPSGLALYWLTNTILSVAQQWNITRILAKTELKRS